MKMAELPKDNDPYGGLGLFITLFPESTVVAMALHE